jgi:nucleoside-diphosphate-sugar epimerase
MPRDGSARSVEDPLLDARINIIGLNLLEASKDAGVKKVIFASSGGAVYGDGNRSRRMKNIRPNR